MLLGRHQLTRHDSARRLVRDSVTSSSETMDFSTNFRYTRRLLSDNGSQPRPTRRARRQQALSDDHSEVEPLLPIPNRNVKRFCADDSGPAPVKVGHRQTPYSCKSPYTVRAFFSSRLLRYPLVDGGTILVELDRIMALTSVDLLTFLSLLTVLPTVIGSYRPFGSSCEK
mgnify:CR=1 FL=1